jgi:hypothetical protein
MQWIHLLLTPFYLTSLVFAAFSASTTYQLQSFSVGPGATNNSASTTYTVQGSTGEQTNGTTSSTTYTAGNGSINTEQIGVPLAPTLSNGSGSYTNQLSVIINSNSDPSDATYSIAVSTDNFVTTYYVGASGTLGATQYYQNYTAWGGSGGSFITGLSSSTTYEVKVAAMQGEFTNTNFGPYATQATGSSVTTFSLTPNSVSLGSLLPGSIETSGVLSFGFTTSGANGGSVYVSGTSNQLHSTTANSSIASYNGNLSSATQGFGIQVTGATQTSGGPFSSVSPYNGTGNTVGSESIVPAQILTTAAAISGGSATAVIQAKAANITPSALDYSETLTFVAAASF